MKSAAMLLSRIARIGAAEAEAISQETPPMVTPNEGDLLRLALRIHGQKQRFGRAAAIINLPEYLDDYARLFHGGRAAPAMIDEDAHKPVRIGCISGGLLLAITDQIDDVIGATTPGESKPWREGPARMPAYARMDWRAFSDDLLHAVSACFGLRETLTIMNAGDALWQNTERGWRPLRDAMLAGTVGLFNKPMLEHMLHDDMSTSPAEAFILRATHGEPIEETKQKRILKAVAHLSDRSAFYVRGNKLWRDRIDAAMKNLRIALLSVRTAGQEGSGTWQATEQAAALMDAALMGEVMPYIARAEHLMDMDMDMDDENGKD